MKPSHETSDSPLPQPGIRRPSLRSSFSWLLWSGILYGLVQWLILVAMARTLSVEDVGTFTLALAVSAPVTMLCNLQLRSLQATDSLGTFDFSDFFALRAGLATASVPVTALIGLAFTTSNNTPLICLLVGVAKALESISDVIHGYYQRRELVRLIAYSLLVKSGALVVFVVPVLVASHSLRAAAISQAVAFGITLVAFDLRWLRGAGGRELHILPVEWPVSAARIRRMARLGMPLGFSAAAGSLKINMPRYFLQAHAGASALGFFGAVSYLNIALGRIVLSLNTAAAARLADSFHQDRAVFKGLLRRLILVIALLGLGGVALAAIAGKELLGAFYGPQYSSYSVALTLVLLAAAFAGLAQTFQLVLTISRKTKIQAYAAAASLVTGLAASAFLVPRWSVLGGAIALAATFGVEMLVSLFAALTTLRALLEPPIRTERRSPAAQDGVNT